jgi:small subunit ribosomal protein S18
MAKDFDTRDDFNGDDLEDNQRMDIKGGSVQRRIRRRRTRRACPDYIDWKDVDYLKQFLPERGKIMPRRISGVSADAQRRIARAIKRARNMALLPYTTD